MTVRTFEIADAILNPAIREYRDVNLAGIESVQAYAKNGMNYHISVYEAEVILDACRAYLADDDMLKDDLRRKLKAWGPTYLIVKVDRRYSPNFWQPVSEEFYDLDEAVDCMHDLWSKVGWTGLAVVVYEDRFCTVEEYGIPDDDEDE